ncbi:hypothetical protein FBY13_101494 [Pantoea sp. SJZ147]|nr:hypothetical protein FBY13_101494 [Pantoea sp. SJZ147]
MHPGCGQQRTRMLLCAALFRLSREKAENPVRAVCGRCRAFTLARPLRDQEIASLASSPVRTPSTGLTPVALPLSLRVIACIITAPLDCAAASSSLLITPLFVGLSFRHGTGRICHPLKRGVCMQEMNQARFVDGDARMRFLPMLFSSDFLRSELNVYH